MKNKSDATDETTAEPAALPEPPPAVRLSLADYPLEESVTVRVLCPQLLVAAGGYAKKGDVVQMPAGRAIALAENVEFIP